MSSPEDEMIELEMRDYWWSVGEAVMKEMCEDDWPAKNDGELEEEE